MSISLKDLKVGDQVFYVPTDPRDIKHRGYMKITKIGKKYVYVGHRDYKAVPRDDHDYSIGIITDYPHADLYASEEDYLEHCQWAHLVRGIQHFTLSREKRQQIVALVTEEVEFPEKILKTKEELPNI